MRLANQFQQMMVLHMLDLVRQADKAPVNIVQRPPIKLVSQLFAPHAQRVPARMLA